MSTTRTKRRRVCYCYGVIVTICVQRHGNVSTACICCSDSERGTVMFSLRGSLSTRCEVHPAYHNIYQILELSGSAVTAGNIWPAAVRLSRCLKEAYV